MKKSLSYCLVAGALAAAVLGAASPAAAQAVPCGCYQPGMLAWIAGALRPAPCTYQGDYIAQQGPIFDGPAIYAPQPTYAPRPTLNYTYGGYRDQPAYVGRAVRHHTVKRTVRRNSVVRVKNESPRGKGKPEVVRANAEVRIYGRDKMDIRLYRR